MNGRLISLAVEEGGFSFTIKVAEGYEEIHTTGLRQWLVEKLGHMIDVNVSDKYWQLTDVGGKE